MIFECQVLAILPTLTFGDFLNIWNIDIFFLWLLSFWCPEGDPALSPYIKCLPFLLLPGRCSVKKTDFVTDHKKGVTQRSFSKKLKLYFLTLLVRVIPGLGSLSIDANACCHPNQPTAPSASATDPDQSCALPSPCASPNPTPLPPLWALTPKAELNVAPRLAFQSRCDVTARLLREHQGCA